MKKETQKKERNEGDGKMRNERHEMVTDNVSANHQFCNVAKMIPHEEVDVSKMETTTPTREKSSVVGNSAKMREALMEASIALSSATHHHMTEDDAKDCLAVIETAISGPPRNCDVGTPEEQNERFLKFCTSMDCERYCPLFKADSCELAWAQMPYEEGGAK